MAKISGDTADIPAVRFNEQGSDLAAPTAGGWKLYFKSGGAYIRNSAGTVYGPLLVAAPAVALNDLTDVDADIPETGMVLTYTGAVWSPATPAGAVALDDLTDVTLGSPSTGHVLTYDTDHWESAAPAGGANGTKIIGLGITGVLAAGGGGALGYAVPFTCTITNVRAMVGTAPTGAAIRVDIHKDGTTIFTDQAERPNIADGATVDLTNTPAVTAVTKDAVLRLYADSVGSTTPGADLHVDIEVTV